MADELLTRLIAAVGARYEISDEIGRGGMGVVFRARDVRLRRSVAIKLLPPELAFREEVRSRFLREAQVQGQLEHPSCSSPSCAPNYRRCSSTSSYRPGISAGWALIWSARARLVRIGECRPAASATTKWTSW